MKFIGGQHCISNRSRVFSPESFKPSHTQPHRLLIEGSCNMHSNKLSVNGVTVNRKLMRTETLASCLFESLRHERRTNSDHRNNRLSINKSFANRLIRRGSWQKGNYVISTAAMIINRDQLSLCDWSWVNNQWSRTSETRCGCRRIQNRNARAVNKHPRGMKNKWRHCAVVLSNLYGVVVVKIWCKYIGLWNIWCNCLVERNGAFRFWVRCPHSSRSGWWSSSPFRSLQGSLKA